MESTQTVQTSAEASHNVHLLFNSATAMHYMEVNLPP